MIIFSKKNRLWIEFIFYTHGFIFGLKSLVLMNHDDHCTAKIDVHTSNVGYKWKGNEKEGWDKGYECQAG